MKNANSRGRPRSRNIPGKRVPNRNQVFESNGPGVRVRGNAQQLVEKYLAMARDATSQGDRILAENCHQHADHYQRVLNALAGRYVKAEENGANATSFDDDDALPNQVDDGDDDGSDQEPEATVVSSDNGQPVRSTTERLASPQDSSQTSQTGADDTAASQEEAPRPRSDRPRRRRIPINARPADGAPDQPDAPKPTDRQDEPAPV